MADFLGIAEPHDEATRALRTAGFQDMRLAGKTTQESTAIQVGAERAEADMSGVGQEPCEVEAQLAIKSPMGPKRHSGRHWPSWNSQPAAKQA